MSDFFRTARRAGAEEYGRKRAETYARRAKAGALLCWLACALLVFGIVVAAQGGFGG